MCLWYSAKRVTVFCATEERMTDVADERYRFCCEFMRAAVYCELARLAARGTGVRLRWSDVWRELVVFMGRARVCLAGQVTGNGERPPPETVQVESGRVQQREERRNVRPWSARVHPARLHSCRHAPLLRVSEVGTERRVSV